MRPESDLKSEEKDSSVFGDDQQNRNKGDLKLSKKSIKSHSSKNTEN